MIVSLFDFEKKKQLDHPEITTSVSQKEKPGYNPKHPTPPKKDYSLKHDYAKMVLCCKSTTLLQLITKIGTVSYWLRLEHYILYI